MPPYNTFDDVVESRFHNKSIKVQCIVSGKSLVPYHIPKTIKIKCLNPKCKGCRIQNETTVEIDATDQNILRFVDIKTSQFEGTLKDVLGIKCRSLSYEVVDVQLIERVYIARPTGKERTRKGGGARPAYVVGLSLETNNIYELKGYTTVDPTTQQTTHVFTKAHRKSSDIDSFVMTPEKHKALCAFRTDNLSVEEMFDRLEKLYNSYAHNITKIYNRIDLHMAVDLVFRSVISFRFDNEYVHKGWADVMILGDTRCGKGHVAERLVEYFGLGEVVSGENATFAGLVGGLQQFNRHWVITWGKIPMNDCGLLIVDETSGMMEDIWGKLSRVRSEGVAEITKIHSEVANARTRMIYICNAPNKTISEYSYGIQALQDLVKAPEDIARFDYVLIVAHDEVSGKDINTPKKDSSGFIYSRELEQDLILWCWSRKPEQIEFTEKATKLIYSTAMRLGKMYDFSIPLIQVENARFKLAKLAIAFAARFYSSSSDGEKLIVRSAHVECAFVFLNMIYGKECCGYSAYSKMKQSMFDVALTERLSDLDKYVESWKLQKRELLKFLLINTTINPDDIVVHLGCSQYDANDCMSRLLKLGFLRKRGTTYIKTPELTGFLKSRIL